ncbi:MAG: tRNA (adenosine(37)-N6)-dimethylallyltransferase MiaA [Pikeienuella sp.]
MTPLLISGPTASGKSALALSAAAESNGVIINADASQIYDGWRVLTARPSVEDEAQADHRLYGYVDPATRFSVGDWLRDVAALLPTLEGRRPIFVGGTGLYFRALTEGLAEIPQPSEEVRARIADRLSAEGTAGLAADLMARDKATADITDLNNHMRVARALEVLEETGKGMAAWRAETPPPLIPDAEKILVLPDRAHLYTRCDARFDLMIQGGALAEAKAMQARGLDPILPAMKAVGAPELFAYLKGEMTMEQAGESAKQATRNYAKRQMTWMRNRMKDWTIVNPMEQPK